VPMNGLTKYKVSSVSATFGSIFDLYRKILLARYNCTF